jgi:hypothetical protein
VIASLVYYSCSRALPFSCNKINICLKKKKVDLVVFRVFFSSLFFMFVIILRIILSFNVIRLRVLGCCLFKGMFWTS